MLKDVTLGQFFPGQTPIHKLDPRTKLSELHYQKRDFLAYLSGAALLAVMIVLRQLGL